MSRGGPSREQLLEEIEALRRQVAVGCTAEERLAAELEQRVAERTAELTRSNEKLRREIAQREKAEVSLRRVEEELRASRQMLWLVMDTIPQALFWKDTNSVYLGCNRRFAQEAGVRDPREVVGKTDYELAWKEDARFYTEFDSEVMAGDRAMQEFVQRRRQADGQMAWLDVRKVPLHNQEGEVVGVLGTAADITKRRLLEAQVREAKKLESLGVLAGGVAHDFNNFLTVILGYTSLLLKQLPQESGLDRHVLQIERASERASELVHQMLTYAGRNESELEALDLRVLVQEMAQLLRISISKEVELSFHFPDEIPTVEADASQLRQIVMNLIVNANDALGGAAGVVSIKAEEVEVDRDYLRGTYLADQELATGPYVCLEVSDTGCGMDRATRTKLFDPFFTTKKNGRGLGMASVLGIVRAHSGTIKVESEVGKGTTFQILFPASGKPTTFKPCPEAEALQGEGKILVVDDDETMRTVTAKILESCGFTVLVAEDGLQALEVFRSHWQDVRAVFLDMNMPRLGGTKTFHELRRFKPSLEILLTSGFREQQAAVGRLLSEGHASFIRKPFGAAALKEEFRKLLDS